MYPNNGYYGQPYGQPYPSGNPYTMGTTQYSSPQSQMQYPPFNPTNAQLRTEIQQKDLAASQCAQNAYLIQQLRPAAIPAFNVPNPYANYGYGCYCNSANGC